ncbi:MAG: STAS domain-containing protein [Planctomycetota bacterium]|nr:STAS domain-containing protein [Planctomycetota bacterium]
MGLLAIDTVWEDGLCRMALSGEARLETISGFDRVAREAEARGANAVLVDLAALDFMDSASTGSVLRLHLAMEEHGGRLVLHSPPPLIRKLFDRLGLRHLRVAEDLSSARAQASPAPGGRADDAESASAP